MFKNGGEIMKKFMALLALTGLTVGMITGCGAAKDTNETGAPAKEAESTGSRSGRGKNYFYRGI